AAPAQVLQVGHQDQDRQEEQRDPGLPGLHYPWADVVHDEQHPDVRPDAPHARHHEHAELLCIGKGRDAVDAHGGDDEHVEGGAADDGERSQRVCGLLIVQARDGLHHGKQDLRGGRAERHQRQVGHRLVPDQHLGRTTYLSLHHFIFLRVPLADGSLSRCNHLYTAHEDVRGNGDTDEEVEESDAVEEAPEPLGPKILCWQQQP
ncbi:hypothetical protein EGW08_017871, partial [Elysia chlorotica]